MLDLTSVQVQDFIRNFEGDPLELILKGSPFEGVDVKILAQQIQGRRQIRKKLPLWYDRTGVLYPPGLNLEQTSSQATAQYKASLCEGSAGADLTGGWGVDTFYLSGQFDHFDYFEEQTSLAVFRKIKKVIIVRIVDVGGKGRWIRIGPVIVVLHTQEEDDEQNDQNQQTTK